MPLLKCIQKWCLCSKQNLSQSVFCEHFYWTNHTSNKVKHTPQKWKVLREITYVTKSIVCRSQQWKVHYHTGSSTNTSNKLTKQPSSFMSIQRFPPELYPFPILPICICVSVLLCTRLFLIHMLHMWYDIHIHPPIYTHQIFDLYVQFDFHICFSCLLGNSRWNTSWSWQYKLILLQRCWNKINSQI